MNLLDHPQGHLYPHIIESLEAQLIDELRNYAAQNVNDIQRGAVTPELAATLIDKYGSGMAKAAAIIGLRLDLQGECDRLVLGIDPQFGENRRRRWSARPADLSLGSSATT